MSSLIEVISCLRFCMFESNNLSCNIFCAFLYSDWKLFSFHTSFTASLIVAALFFILKCIFWQNKKIITNVISQTYWFYHKKLFFTKFEINVETAKLFINQNCDDNKHVSHYIALIFFIIIFSIEKIWFIIFLLSW